MDFFEYKDGKLLCEAVYVKDIVKDVNTPCYIYSKRTITEHYQRLRDAFSKETDLLICYSIKANSNLSILKLLYNLGAGFDVVSGGELYRALKIKADPKKIVFAGVGKTDEEIKYAIENNILLINVESRQELGNINKIAGDRIVDVALRLNPDVFAHTHPYITTGVKTSKFGISFNEAIEIIKEQNKFKNLQIKAVHIHIGSQVETVKPYVQAAEVLLEFVVKARKIGVNLEYVNIGGGFGIYYKQKAAKAADELADGILPIIKKTGCKLLIEPGRFIVGNAGILVTKVLYTKQIDNKKFVVCDSGMNHLIRPVLYDAYHKIWSVEEKDNTTVADVVGPVCETGDFFAKDREIPEVKSGDLLAIFGAGAYGYSMSSNYNSQPRPCEVLVDNNRFNIITKRETYQDLIKNEVF